MRTKQEIRAIFKTWKEGKHPSESSKVLNIPRCTIRDWFKKFDTGTYPNWLEEADSKSAGESPCGFESHRAYSYIFGLYLGDGHISKIKVSKNGNVVYRLRITQDAKYSNLIQEHQKALEELFPHNKVNITKAPGCSIINIYSGELSTFFPQHGPGRKHHRPIILKSWQQQIIEKFPKEFLKGLYQSDGCRYIDKRKNGYEYVYYSFTNLSKDILELWNWACDLINVQTDFTNKKTQRVSTRKDVEKLEKFLSPKS